MKIRRSARHLAPKPRPHTTTPSHRPEPVALWPMRPVWDIFEPESVAWTDDWLTADDLRGVA